MIQLFNQYISLKSLCLAVLESCMIATAVVCAARLRFWADVPEFRNYVGRPEFVYQVLVVIVVFEVCFHFCNLYDRSAVRNRPDELLHTAQAIGAGGVLLGLLYTLSPDLLIGRGVFVISLALITAFVVFTRVVLDQAWRFAVRGENVLIVGAGALGQTVAHELKRRGDLNLKLVGFIETGGEAGGVAEMCDAEVFGGTERLEQVAHSCAVDRIIVALNDRRGTLPTRELVRLRVEGVRVEDAHSIIASLSGRVWLETVRPSWFVFSDGFHRSRPTLVLKRLVDFTCALTGLVLAAPIMLLLAILIRLESPGPVIYRQQRVGKGSHTFNVLKFRSMKIGAESNGAQWAQHNDPRVTRLGAFLRKYRFDELPQLINILRGEMSFVGPRPERPVFVEQLRLEIPYYDERHSVRPGLTGWAQVLYPYGATVEDAKRKLEYDLFYLKNLSLFFDLSILLRTARVVFNGTGAR